MIQLGGILLVMAGATATPYIKKAFRNIQAKKDNRKNIANASNSRSSEDSDVLIATTKNNIVTTPDEGRYKHRFILTTGTMGIAVIAQTSVAFLVPVSYLLIGYFSANIFQKAGDAVFKDKKIKVDILDASVILLTLLFGEIAAAAFMVWVLDLADMLLQRTSQKSQQCITDIFGEQPRFAWLVVDDAEVETDVKTLKQGDIIVIGRGESIPVDGVIISGDATIDQKNLTSESRSADKQKDDKVFASTVILAGKIYVEVKETAENTLVSQLVSIVNETSNHHLSRSTGEKIADKMVIPTMGLGAMGYVTTGSGALLAIINADYGTGIRVAAPIAVLAYLGSAAKKGILIKHSKAIEMLKDIDVVLFDKKSLIELNSTAQEETAKLIADLRTYGIKEMILISDDNDVSTQELFQQLNIDRYFTCVLPNEKSDYVKLLQDEGKKVMMVGDGINDSVALSYADISVSLKGASTIGTDVADVIFMDGHLTQLNDLFEISKNLKKNIKRSFLLIAIPNTLCILGAFMGVFGLAASLALNNSLNLIAAANGMLPYTEKTKKREPKKG